MYSYVQYISLLSKFAEKLNHTLTALRALRAFVSIYSLVALRTFRASPAQRTLASRRAFWSRSTRDALTTNLAPDARCPFLSL